MRRRRPSALYTVLDEEQLLGGVDLTDHPDPAAGRPGTATGDEWDEWSPELGEHPHEGSSGEWQVEDLEVEVEVDSRSVEAEAEAELCGGGRRRWLTLGFAGVLVLVLLAARELGAALDTAGSRPAGQAVTAGPTPDPRPPVARSAARVAAARPGSRLPTRLARRSSGGSRPRPHPAAPDVGSGVRGSVTRRARSRPARAPVGPLGRPTAPAPRPGPATPSRSPDQEFGFER